MTSPTPLTGTDLVDCAKANAKQGVEVTAKLCGYGEDLKTFTQELEKACEHMGVQVSDLMTQENVFYQKEGTIIAPDTPSDI
jgi:DNA-binding Xre family transcriptional regulator